MICGKDIIKAGGSFYYKGDRCVTGAVLSIRGRMYLAAASHIFRRTGCSVKVGGKDGIVKRFLEDYDTALIELPDGSTAEITELGSAIVMEEAFLINERHTIWCRITRAGASLISLQFPCSDMPQPGDSGSPVFQEGMVVGLLSSIMLGNCTGTAISSDVLRSLCR